MWTTDLIAASARSAYDHHGETQAEGIARTAEAVAERLAADIGPYLTWCTVAGDSFSMFRRAKLMLADLPADADEVTVDVDLTDERGMPRCARLPPSALRIS